MTKLKPCPFCGMEPDLENGDTLYPNAVGWRIEKNGRRTFHSYRDVPPEQWCYSMHCPETAGGCGAEISGLTQEEAIEKWNKRT